MKINTQELTYEEVMKLPPKKHKKPVRPNFIFRTLMKIAGDKDLKETNFKYEFLGKEKWDKGPYFILMNHSSFIDLEIIGKIFSKKPTNIVATSDSFVGKEWLMRNLGCIPTNKFTTDMNFVADIQYAIKHKTNVLMYPEAGYSFDGTSTTIQRGLGILLKKLKTPVLMVKTKGAFLRDPLYNDLKKRKIDVSAQVYQLFSLDEVKNMPLKEMTEKLDEAFSFDYFKEQYDEKIEITEPFRADGLERVLFKCPECGAEQMEGKGTGLVCHNCQKSYFMTTLGRLEGQGFKEKFYHIPDWYKWQRSEVKKEIENGTYSLETDVKIAILKDTKALYFVGEGKLTHSKDGFNLYNDKGELLFYQSPTTSYSLNTDYFWYEIDDIICIGNNEILYYCFPKTKIPVAKARLATEEIYKIIKGK